MWKLAHLDYITEEVFEFEEFPADFGKITLFFISDIHRRTVSPELIEKVKKKADLVIIGGDLAEKGVPISRIETNIKTIKEAGPVYFVWGNNDYEIDYHMLDAILHDNRVKILDNTSVSFESGNGEKLHLLGVDDLNQKRDRLDLALQDSGQGFKILVSHDPRISHKIKAEDRISLILSGHTHGGQIRLGPWGLYKPGGLTRRSNTALFISNGYGTTAIPLRLGVPAQTHLITLQSGHAYKADNG
ncbi:metallophosphoesterase [Bacillus marinisedimentorum]|uniref:metallophosphoesterase n=1 Tax=Bacillus marinisedimentorum TaxID=1821260 RepID=UPI0009F35F57|nr:metallophosphoesterase [Bacillus marinisedimentorum]